MRVAVTSLALLWFRSPGVRAEHPGVPSFVLRCAGRRYGVTLSGESLPSRLGLACETFEGGWVFRGLGRGVSDDRGAFFCVA